MKAVCYVLLFLMGALWLPSCSVRASTPMLGHENCDYLPSVEDCQETASRLITDDCLRDCVIEQCSKGLALCGAEVVARCSELALEHPEGKTGGYVLAGPQTCEMPKKYVNWCQVEQSPRCQELSMVHERCHACGWRHGQGKGVPGDDGEIRGCKSPDH
jgi:hypothetical protein